MGDRMVRKKDKTAREENWAELVSPKGKLIQSKQTEMELSCPACCFLTGIWVHLPVWFTHCGGPPLSLPEYRPLSIPGQLLSATEKNWMALFPSLGYHFLSTKEVKCQELHQENWREAGRRWNHREEQKPPSIPERQKKRKNTRCLGVIKLY